MSDELSTEARELLAAARPGYETVPADEPAKVWARLEPRLGEPFASTGGAAAAVPLALKGVIVAVISGVAGWAAWPEAGAPVPDPAPAVVSPPSSPVGRVPVVEAAVRAPQPAPPVTKAEPPTPEPPRPASERPRTRPAPARAAEPRREPSSLADEIALMKRARSDFSAGRTGEALRALEDHERRFAAGTLASERDALRVRTLCRAGRIDEGRARAVAFLARWPGSPLAASVRDACPAPQGR